MTNIYRNLFYEKYKKNINSQNGEDGIIEELRSRLNISTGIVCEFGAADGIWNSNTFELVKNGFKGIFIEGDRVSFSRLIVTASKYNIIAINKYVSIDGDNSLDNIFLSLNIPDDIFCLSIDIDSYDYQVWMGLIKYQPMIVIIEINSGGSPIDPNHIHGQRRSDGTIYDGTGFLPMYKLGKEKGYELLCHTGNMIFIRKDLINKIQFSPEENPLTMFRVDWLSQKNFHILDEYKKLFI